jgi:hypothetical protein
VVGGGGAGNAVCRGACRLLVEPRARAETGMPGNLNLPYGTARAAGETKDTIMNKPNLSHTVDLTVFR